MQTAQQRVRRSLVRRLGPSLPFGVQTIQDVDTRDVIELIVAGHVLRTFNFWSRILAQLPGLVTGTADSSAGIWSAA